MSKNYGSPRLHSIIRILDIHRILSTKGWRPTHDAQKSWHSKNAKDSGWGSPVHNSWNPNTYGRGGGPILLRLLGHLRNRILQILVVGSSVGRLSHGRSIGRSFGWSSLPSSAVGRSVGRSIARMVVAAPKHNFMHNHQVFADMAVKLAIWSSEGPAGLA